MSLHHMLRASAQQQAAGPSDPYFEYNTLLLTGNGTNGAQNNTFLDSSTNNFTITRNGNTTQGTFSPFSLAEGQWSNYFDGVNDYLEVPDSTAFDFGSGDFTIECWFNFGAVPSSGGVSTFVSQWRSTISISLGWIAVLYNNAGTYQLSFSYSTTGSNQVNLPVNLASAPAVGSWNHVAFVRSGTNFLIFLNGSQVGTTQTLNATIFNSTAPVWIGAQNSGGTPDYDFNGYISNLRIVKGTALYTSAFTPSTTPLTAVSGTSLLTCQSNRFIDNSSNNFPLTVNGNTSVQRFSPFNPTAPYDAATIGGSGYFDGAGDYLTVPDNAAWDYGTNNFCIEFFTYVTANLQTYQIFVGQETSAGRLWVGLESQKLWFSIAGGAAITDTADFPLNQWVHVKAQRVSGVNYLYKNGVLVNSASETRSINGSSALYIGANSNGATQTHVGYLSNLRILNNVSLSTADFTPPTSPVTAISGTSLLCNMTNAGIPNAAMMNDLETVGNAQVSTSVKKYGTGSLAFYGTGDGIRSVGTNVNLQLGSGDFTIEGWVYFNSVSGNSQIVNTATATTNTSYAIYRSATTLQFYLSSTGTTWNIASGGTIGTVTTNTWYHFALVRNGSTFTPYFNGVAGSSVTSSASLFANTGVGVGNDAACTSTDVLNGYIDDLRITKGYARYTANFTPPTAALPTY